MFVRWPSESRMSTMGSLNSSTRSVPAPICQRARRKTSQRCCAGGRCCWAMSSGTSGSSSSSSWLSRLCSSVARLPASWDAPGVALRGLKLVLLREPSRGRGGCFRRPVSHWWNSANSMTPEPSLSHVLKRRSNSSGVADSPILSIKCQSSRRDSFPFPSVSYFWNSGLTIIRIFIAQARSGSSCASSPMRAPAARGLGCSRKPRRPMLPDSTLLSMILAWRCSNAVNDRLGLAGVACCSPAPGGRWLHLYCRPMYATNSAAQSPAPAKAKGRMSSAATAADSCMKAREGSSTSR
mmetsp:Transcript_89932/g.254869  ORF Transcript_89932/g.254869 Transcript_89932/m.254869 type:complete len:295 (-) Transcript_89932:558-1442(-)